MRKQLLSTICLGAGLLLSGCGGSSDGDTPSVSTALTTASNEYNVNIIDEPIIGARVNAPECTGYKDNGNGSYTLTGCLMKPTSIEALGGVIDLNGNGSADVNETAQTAPLKLRVAQTNLSNGFTVSPLTTLASGSDTDLTALANALGISKEDLFSAQNTQLQQAVNVLLISARDAGIVKYDTFLDDLCAKIATSSKNGLDAISEAHDYMKTHQDEYVQKYGIAFGGFISDTTALDTTDPTASLVNIAQQNSVSTGKIKLAGFIYDRVIANATVTLYDGDTPLVSTTSDTLGRYALEVDDDILQEPKVLKLEAVLQKTKLVSYITTQEIKDGLIAQKLSSANEVALIVSNVTTAKAVLIEKTDPQALNDPQKLQEAKVKVEATYPSELIEVSAAIQDVVDNNKTITHSDTLAFAQSIVEQNTTTQLIDVTLPDDIDINTTAVTEDPMLSAQLNNSENSVVPAQSYRAIIEDKDMYNLEYWGSNLEYEYGRLGSNGTYTYEQYEQNANGEWELERSETTGADTHISWSPDNTVLFVSGEWQPFKETLVSTETIYVHNTPVHVYRVQYETIGEPTQLYFDNFIKISHHQGSINFSSFDDANKTIEIVYDDGDQEFTAVYVLDDNGTYQQGYYDPDNVVHTHGEHYKYRVAQYYGKTYVIFDDGQTHDGDGRIFYVDMQNHKAYQRDFHSIGFKDTGIKYDNVEVVNLWKNLTQDERDLLQRMFEENVWANQNYSASYTYYQATQNTIYSFIKTIAAQ